VLLGYDVDYILHKKRNDKFTGNKHTRRGQYLEPIGIKLASDVLGIEVHNTGIITNENYPLIAYSPDGLIDTDGLVEHKAFNEERHFSS